MPYFWESARWRKRLNELGIQIPESSKYQMQDYVTSDHSEGEMWRALAKSTLCTISSLRKGHQSDLFNLANSAIRRDAKGIYIRPLFDMLNLSAGDSIAEHLLSANGIGRVVITDETRFQQRCIEEFLTSVLSSMAEKDSRLMFTPVGIGSMAEQCKIGYADEYDYRLDMSIETDLTQYIEDDFKLMRLYNEINKGSLCFIKNFYALFIDILSKLTLAESKTPLTYLAHGFNNSGVIFLIFRWNNGMLIKVDCVPSITAQGIWPSTRDKDPLGMQIPKLSHIILTQDTENDRVNVSWSICNAEVCFARGLPDYIKDGYALSKIICGELLEESHFLSAFSNLTKSTSYVLKNRLYDYINSSNTISLDQENNVETVLLVAKAILQKDSNCVPTSFFLGERMLGFKIFSSLAYDIAHELEKQHKTRYVPPEKCNNCEDKVDKGLRNEFEALYPIFSECVQIGFDMAATDYKEVCSKDNEIARKQLSLVDNFTEYAVKLTGSDSPINIHESIAHGLQGFLRRRIKKKVKECPDIDLD